ncbi:MAG: hypothetical protein KGL39_40400 [Patescibacteria group bacterium]|nr:hypothetical protein [Patescibacteria group bacterium]
MRRVIVGFSGGVTSAWCGGWALRNFPHEEVIFLFHDTKEEDEDTYRFLHEMAARLNHPITERSDGRSVTELAHDHNALPNNMMAFCSHELKIEPGNRFMEELKQSGANEIIKVFGFSANESERVQRMTAMGWKMGFTPRFPLIEENVTKQDCADWCSCTMGVVVPRMYSWSDHANCVGCVRGGKAYWLAVKDNVPEVFAQRKAMEAEFGATFNRRYSLIQIEKEGLFHKVGRREAIEVGPCECGS